MGHLCGQKQSVGVTGKWLGVAVHLRRDRALVGFLARRLPLGRVVFPVFRSKLKYRRGAKAI